VVAARTTRTVEPAPGRLRVVASARDYALISAWIGLLTLAGVVLRFLVPTARAAPLHDKFPAVDLAAFAITVLPVGIYLTVTEAGTRQASWGKRRAGLRVVSTDGGRAGPWRVALRVAVKLAPWELGHLAAARLIAGVDLARAVWAADALSLLLPAASIAMAWRDPQARALHDRVAGTLVVVA